MNENFNPRRPEEREKRERTPADLRRTLGRIYPEEMLDELMERLGFKEELNESCDD